jgi:hypothetical protein
MKKMFQIVTYRDERTQTGDISGPFSSRETAERALNSLFQSGKASSGKVREVAVEDDDNDDSDNAA